MQMDDKTGKNSLGVLVVEDDQSVRRMLRFSLRDAGFEIAETAVGAEAIQILDNRPPEAVILDLGLADAKGGAVLDWLRQKDGACNEPPVWMVISAVDREEASKRYGALGSRFLAKPFDPWELVRRLKELLAAKDGLW